MTLYDLMSAFGTGQTGTSPNGYLAFFSSLFLASSFRTCLNS